MVNELEAKAEVLRALGISKARISELLGTIPDTTSPKSESSNTESDLLPKSHRIRYPGAQATSQELEKELDEEFYCWVLEEWRRVSIPEWRRILAEAKTAGDSERAEYAEWMLRDILEADDEW